VFMSIAFADDTQSRALEPGATVPSKRFEALRALSEAGIPTGIAVAPVIPGLTDAQIPELLARAKQAGAKHAFMTPLRLPREVGEVFESRLREVLPGYADKVMSQVLQIRGGKGKKNDARFGERMRGQGPRFAMIEDLFVLHCARQGLSREMDALIPNTFERPRAQLALF
jgi:DNA repair photolyase